jgi:putative oxidoreductase
MKMAMIIIRILMGLMFLFSSAVFFLKLYPQPVLKGNIKVFMDGLNAAGYLLPLIKATELICAILLLIGRFVPLAVVVIFPVIVNIVFVHAFLGPENLPVAIALLLGDLFLAYYYRNNYKTLLVAK